MHGMSQPANMFSSGVPMSSAHSMGGIGSQAMRGGGILSKLLGGLGGAHGAGPTMGGFSSAAPNGMNLSAMLANAQKIVGLGQQVLPMIHQYGPLIRNAPALWKIMRSSNSTDEPISNQENEGQSPETTFSEHNSELAQENIQSHKITIDEYDSEKPRSLSVEENKKTAPTLFTPKSIDGIPAPKLYV
jgi:hypothetical protein